MKTAYFARGRDRVPRKKRIINATKTALGIGAGSALAGIGLAGTLPTIGLLASPDDSKLQRRLALVGLGIGSAYGAYKGIQRARKNKTIKIRYE